MMTLNRPTTRYLAVLALMFGALSACSSHGTNMIHPQSGATAECSAGGLGFGASFSAAFVENCSRTYEERGYVSMEKLTPEQRSSLERRGLIR